MLTCPPSTTRKPTQRMLYAKNAAEAFTVVEIMAAVIVLCVLAALMMPAFQQTREVMRTTQCMQHMRSLGINTLATLQERNGALPWYDAKSGRSGMWWYNIHRRDDFASFNSTMSCPSAEKRYLYAYAHQGKPLYGTYRYNKFMGYQNTGGTWIYPITRLAAQKDPHRLALLTDFRHSVADKGDDSTGFETWPSAIEAHRKSTTAVVFCLDGHMEQVTDPATSPIVINPVRIK